MSYIRKTKDEYQLQCNYGYGDGWEEVCAEETYTEIKKRKKEYVENLPQYSYRIVTKRVKIAQ